MKMSPGALFVIERLNHAGFEAYLVGGCVRDALLGKPSKDIDVATSALPQKIKGLFEKTWDTGLRYGTVTVGAKGEKVEVTTFRKDLAYIDHRRPHKVSFSHSLYEDLSRRDFTINAMAWHKSTGLVDPFDGQGDIKRRLIRCVGDPKRRFEEDALRMLRAVRFCARLGFFIEEATKAAILEKSPLAVTLSPERVQAELCKILASPRPEAAGLLLSLGLLDAYLNKRGADLIAPFQIKLPHKEAEFEVAAAAFFAYLLEAGAISSVLKTLSCLRFDNRTKRTVSQAVASLAGEPAKTPAALKERMYRYGKEAVKTGLLAQGCGGEAVEEQLAWLEEIEKKGEPYNPSQLALSPIELKEMGYEGKEIKKAMEKLLAICWENPGHNNRPYLLSQLKK